MATTAPGCEPWRLVLTTLELARNDATLYGEPDEPDDPDDAEKSGTCQLTGLSPPASPVTHRTSSASSCETDNDSSYGPPETFTDYYNARNDTIPFSGPVPLPCRVRYRYRLRNDSGSSDIVFGTLMYANRLSPIVLDSCDSLSLSLSGRAFASLSQAALNLKPISQNGWKSFFVQVGGYDGEWVTLADVRPRGFENSMPRPNVPRASVSNLAMLRRGPDQDFSVTDPELTSGRRMSTRSSSVSRPASRSESSALHPSHHSHHSHHSHLSHHSHHSHSSHFDDPVIVKPTAPQHQWKPEEVFATLARYVCHYWNITTPSHLSVRAPSNNESSSGRSLSGRSLSSGTRVPSMDFLRERYPDRFGDDTGMVYACDAMALVLSELHGTDGVLYCSVSPGSPSPDYFLMPLCSFDGTTVSFSGVCASHTHITKGLFSASATELATYVAQKCDISFETFVNSIRAALG